jgi:hypothetical protein
MKDILTVVGTNSYDFIDPYYTERPPRILVNYVLNLETGTIRELNRNYISQLLEPYPDLLTKFDNNNETDYLLYFLEKVNEREKF